MPLAMLLIHGRPGPTVRERDPGRLQHPGLETALVFAVALVTRLIAVNEAGMFDEYYHALAAREWLADGTLGSPDGQYHYGRAAAFTYLVMLSMRAFGDNLIAARIPALLAGALWPALIYLAVRRFDGRRAAAAFAAGFAILDPTLLGLSQVARFYSLHGLLFWVGVFSLYWLTSENARSARRPIWAVLALAAFWAAAHLQLITVIGLGAVIAGLLVADSPRVVDRLKAAPRNRVWPVLITTVLVAGVVLWLGRDALRSGWEQFRTPLPWLAGGSSVKYYHWWLQSTYPMWWVLLPMAFVIAAVQRRRLTLFCGVAFGVAFLIGSLAANRLPRYMAYATPFMFIVWGLALTDVLPMVRDLCRRASTRIFGTDRWGLPVLAGAVAFVVLNTPAWMSTMRALNPLQPTAPYETKDWPRIGQVLGSDLRNARVVLSSVGPPILYHFGRLDFEIGAILMPDGEPGAEFTVDPRTGRRVITSVSSVERLTECYATGLVVAREGQWRDPGYVTPQLADWIEEHMERIGLPADFDLRTYRWETDVADPADPGCPTLHPPT